MRTPIERLVCPKCGEEVHADDLECPACKAPLESVIIKRATRGRRYVYGKRKAGLSPEIVWLLIVILIGILLIVGAQLFAFMRSRKLVERPSPPAAIARLLSPTADAECCRCRGAATPAAARPLPVHTIAAMRGQSHEVRLRHLCHADRPAGRGHCGPGRHRV
jgi:hypothetical protein